MGAPAGLDPGAGHGLGAGPSWAQGTERDHGLRMGQPRAEEPLPIHRQRGRATARGGCWGTAVKGSAGTTTQPGELGCPGLVGAGKSCPEALR